MIVQGRRIEVQFLGRAWIKKGTQSRVHSALSPEMSVWPLAIRYDIIASITGAMQEHQEVAHGISTLVVHQYHEHYVQSVSDPHSPNYYQQTLGHHLYYPIDLTETSSALWRYIRQLGRAGWLPLSRIPTFGKHSIMLDVLFAPPGTPAWEFAGGAYWFTIDGLHHGGTPTFQFIQRGIMGYSELD